MSDLHPFPSQIAADVSKACYFVFPGDLNTPTGGYRYDHSIVQGLQKNEWDVSLISLAGNYPTPSSSDRGAAIEALGGIEAPALVVVDGLALGASPDLAKDISNRAILIALVHHPLFLESGMEPKLASALKQSETKALTYAERVIVTSPSTRKTLVSQMSVPPGKVSIVLPGIAQAPEVDQLSSKREAGSALQLLCVGSLVPRKGQLHLVEALGRLKHLNWHLDLIGETSFNPQYTRQVRNQIKRYDLADRIHIHGNVSQAGLMRFYQSADLFVLPTYYEGYGMAFAEAMSFGLPIIASGAGAVTSTVPPSAGFHVAAGDATALGDSIEVLLRNDELRNQLSEGSRFAARALPSWSDSAKAFAVVLEGHL
ncbi:glycosyltransferase family 4 protein [Pseudovibrio axinellae]|nr:glycosyltransferase family 4 protein [Pseudovibrio axinellae]